MASNDPEVARLATEDEALTKKELLRARSAMGLSSDPHGSPAREEANWAVRRLNCHDKRLHASEKVCKSCGTQGLRVLPQAMWR
jgi:rRNA maturation endonuclease Nob1